MSYGECRHYKTPADETRMQVNNQVCKCKMQTEPQKGVPQAKQTDKRNDSQARCPFYICYGISWENFQTCQLRWRCPPLFVICAFDQAVMFYVEELDAGHYYWGMHDETSP